MNKTVTFQGITLASAAAGIFLTGCATAPPDISQQASAVTPVHCAGVNSCKGQSSCKGGVNDCKGKNSCKGQGFVALSQEECDAAKARQSI